MGSWPGGWMSGFCCVGQCEGTKPRGAMSGTPMKTCIEIEKCACKCHKLLTQMFEMAGMERVVQENPEYKPQERTWWMPSAEDRLSLSAQEVAKKVTIVESRMPDVLPPDAVREFDDTPSGQRQRGQLEDEVKKITDMWVAMQMPDHKCTPAWVADMIDAENPPSTGAISAVFDRWVEIGFAKAERKPTRFMGYTEEGIKKGMYSMKMEYKLKKRRTAAAANRGVR